MQTSPDIKFITYDALCNKEVFIKYAQNQEPIVITSVTANDLGDFAKFFNIIDIYQIPEETLDLLHDTDNYEVFSAIYYDMSVRTDEVILVCSKEEKEYAEKYFGDGMLEVY